MTENANHRYIKDYQLVRPPDVPACSADGYEPVGGVAVYEGDAYQAMAYYEPVKRIITKEETTDD